MSTVLALARELPYPPNAGDRVVTYGFLRALERRGHDVHVLAYERPDDGPAADALASFCGSVARVPAPDSPLPAGVTGVRRSRPVRPPPGRAP